MTRIEQLISEIEEYIDGCKAQPFTNNKKIIVDKDEMEELLVELRLRIPDEIKKYQKIISNKEAILASAQEEADKTVSSARSEADGILADAQAQVVVCVNPYRQAGGVLQGDHPVPDTLGRQRPGRIRKINHVRAVAFGLHGVLHQLFHADEMGHHEKGDHIEP